MSFDFQPFSRLYGPRIATTDPGFADSDTSLEPLRFSECRLVENITPVSNGDVLGTMPAWIPMKAGEMALQAAFRCYTIPREEVAGGPVPPLEHIRITWKNLAQPGKPHRPSAILDVTRPTGICTAQPPTRKIFFEYEKASSYQWRSLTLLAEAAIKRKAEDERVPAGELSEPTATPSLTPGARPIKRIKIVQSTKSATPRIKIVQSTKAATASV